MICRLYILKGLSIVPHDVNGFSDTYLIVDSGVEKTEKKDGCLVMKTQNPEFFHCYEMKTIIPGLIPASFLSLFVGAKQCSAVGCADAARHVGPPVKVQCWDHDLILDELIGETVIDLENRCVCVCLSLCVCVYVCKRCCCCIAWVRIVYLYLCVQSV